MLGQPQQQYYQEGQPNIWSGYLPQTQEMGNFKKKPSSTKGYPSRKEIPQHQPRSSSHDIQMIQKEDFDLDTFKTQECPLQENHNRKHCPYYHNDNDRRRNLNDTYYNFDECENQEHNNNCKGSHNKVEQLYHPKRYKTKYCESKGPCEYGRYYQELLILQLHQLKQDRNFWVYNYKTVWCPKTNEHCRATCVYAHNAQDYRRDPRVYKYLAQSCEYWVKNNIQSYRYGGCPKMEQCEHSHGWKESEYHPASYKSKKCQHSNCHKKDCAFYHDDEKFNLFFNKKRSQLQLKNPTSLHNNDSKLMLRKQSNKAQSNFPGPILLTDGYQDPDKLKQKFEMGQPFSKAQSSASFGYATADTRKMSDFSNDTNFSSQRSEQIPQPMHRAKTRTTPNTPPDQVRNIDQKDFFSKVVVNLTQFSKLNSKLQNKAEGQAIMHKIQSKNINERMILDLNQQELRSELNFLTSSEFNLVWEAVEKIKVENYDDELILGVFRYKVSYMKR